MAEVGSESLNNRKTIYGALLVLVVSTVILSPFILQGIVNLTTPKVYHGMIMLKSETEGWHTGTLVLTYQDNSFERWEIADYWDMTQVYEEDNILYGYISIAQATRNFTQIETCRLEYYCSGLNMTIGPIAFDSQTTEILYSNDSVPKGLWILWASDYSSP